MLLAVTFSVKLQMDDKFVTKLTSMRYMFQNFGISYDTYFGISDDIYFGIFDDIYFGISYDIYSHFPI